MTGAPRSRSDLLTPQNMLTALALVWGMYGSYTAFQRDTSVQIAGMAHDIDWLKERARSCAR